MATSRRRYPRIVSLGTAAPSHLITQDHVLAFAKSRLLGEGWEDDPALSATARQMEHLFAASRVECRQSSVDLSDYYANTPSTGQRMATYRAEAHELGRQAIAASLAAASRTPEDVTDLTIVSCTGYSAPGLDITLARAMGMRGDVRRTLVGHMGCYGALVGLRRCTDALLARPDATAMLLSVELSALHFAPTLNLDMLLSFALFGDAAAAALLSMDDAAGGPQIVDARSEADFATADQMSWTIGDTGFMMGLSPRVPVTLRRVVRGAVDRLLEPHGLRVEDVAHWVVHPGGPSILEVVQERLTISDEQMEPSWTVLREHGNCSSATVLLILDELIRAKRPSPGEWGVMLAFGPGLTVESTLLRF
jgi:alkylresorcinol/alkylpyrone synthase